MKKKTLWLIPLAVMISVPLFVLQQTNSLRTVGYTWQSGRVPAGFNGFRIAQVSDLHNKRFGKNQARLTKAVRDTKPDLIALTGDFVDLHTEDMGAVTEFLQGVEGVAPIYYVDGNHDPASPFYEALLALFAQYNVTVLAGETVTLQRGGDEMTLAGYPCWDLSRLSGSPDIVLYHDPNGLPQLAQFKPGLVLAGHNHGGQIALPWGRALIGPKSTFLPTYSFGEYRDGSTTMILSRGLGTSGIPFRVFAPPEVVLVTLSNV